MSDSNIIPLNKPDAGDPLQAILKEGAQQLLAQAVEAEIASFLAKHNTEGSTATVVRNGYLPEPVSVKNVVTYCLIITLLLSRALPHHYLGLTLPHLLDHNS